MAKRENNDRDDEINNTFIIPNNFMDSGKVFQGMFEMRNVVEAVILSVVIGYFIINVLDFEMKTKVIATILIVGPIGVAALIGFQGDSVTLFIKKLFLFVRNRRKLRYRRIKKNVEKTDTKGKTRATNKKTKSKTKTKKA